LPLIIADLGSKGLNPDQARIQLGTMVSLGVLAYALGKFLSGGLADFVGGRRNFLLGMAGSIFSTIAFALAGTIPIFTLSWMANRLVQSLGWAGIVKITSKWFSFSTYGTVMGVISLSYLFGDAAARQFMGMLIARGFDWRSVFWAAASVLFVLLVMNLWSLKESPTQIGRPEPPASPWSLFGSRASRSIPSSPKELLAPLFGSSAF
jgi:sugar phosphate permease